MQQHTEGGDSEGAVKSGIRSIRIMLALLLVTQWLALSLWFYWMYLDPEADAEYEECPAPVQELHVRADRTPWRQPVDTA